MGLATEPVYSIVGVVVSQSSQNKFSSLILKRDMAPIRVDHLSGIFESDAHS